MIYIFKGDSTTFADVTKFLTFYIQSPLDLTGWSATFQLGGVTKTINDISSKTFEISLTNQETSRLTYGYQNGTLKLTDDLGQIKTISNTIPFKVVDTVIENVKETITLDIPQSAEVQISVQVGDSPSEFGNIIAGDNIEINYIDDDIKISAIVPDISNLATKQELDTKQPIGDYAYVSDIPTLISQLQNDLGYQTLTDVMGIIASIPQFKLSIVNDLPTTGEKMTLYLVPKEESANDVYNEYIWIEQTSSFELIGTTAVDLTDYVKNTDIATSTKNGIIKANGSGGIKVNSAGNIATVLATNDDIDEKENMNKVIVPANLNYAVNSVLPTMTQAEYDALETKDENLFYMIVEE